MEESFTTLKYKSHFGRILEFKGYWDDKYFNSLDGKIFSFFGSQVYLAGSWNIWDGKIREWKRRDYPFSFRRVGSDRGVRLGVMAA